MILRLRFSKKSKYFRPTNGLKKFDVKGARRSGYSDGELIQYGIDNYPGGYDYQDARATGYSDNEILEDMFNVRADVTKTEAFVEGVKRGAVQSLPVIAGAAGGAVTGFGVFGPLGIIPGMIIGGASGIPAGDQLDQYLFDQTPLKPSQNVPFESGITVGSGLPGNAKSFRCRFTVWSRRNKLSKQFDGLNGTYNSPVKMWQDF